MDLQHLMAEKLALLFLDEKDDEREKAVVTYGIEVVLNEVLKAILILMLGIIFGKTLVAVIGYLYLIIVRRYLGGRHFNSNILCTITTVFTAFVGPVLVMKINVPLIIQIVTSVLLTIIIIVMIPYSEDGPISPEKRRINKFMALLFFWIISIVIYFLVFLGKRRVP